MRYCLIYFVLLFSIIETTAQAYVNGRNTRHRFAQLMLGADMVYFPSSGNTANFTSQGLLTDIQAPAVLLPRLSIGGTHFWGHTYFFVNFPVSNFLDRSVPGGEIFYSPSVETGARLYPWRIERKKVRPFVGFAWSLNDWRQEGANGTGVFESKRRMPLHLGLTYQRKNLLFDLGYGRFVDQPLSYAIDRNTFVDVELPKQYFWVGINWQLETTAGAEKNYLNGITEQRVQTLKERKGISGFSLAIGPSAAFVQGKAPRNELLYPALTKHRGVAIFPDIGLGYYYYHWDLHFNIAHRSNRSTRKAYSIQQQLKRRSVALEAFKFLFDYHGFVPFVGPSLSREWLSLTELDGDLTTADESQQQWAGGITFGWDIRPDDFQPWILRTNLRYTPLKNIGAEGGLSFSQIEFNFIQFVWYPGRAKRMKKIWNN
ncbi:MAG: hypothetical protein AAGJ93_11495 [Bacteroidota bacterium]